MRKSYKFTLLEHENNGLIPLKLEDDTKARIVVIPVVRKVYFLHSPTRIF